MKNFNKFILESKKKYIITGFNRINDIEIDEDIFQEELFEYNIIHRESHIENLKSYIIEARTDYDKYLMEQDLELLEEIDDEFLFSAFNTNYFIYEESAEFNETCEELLELNEKVKKEKRIKKFNI